MNSTLSQRLKFCIHTFKLPLFPKRNQESKICNDESAQVPHSDIYSNAYIPPPSPTFEKRCLDPITHGKCKIFFWVLSSLIHIRVNFQLKYKLKMQNSLKFSSPLCMGVARIFFRGGETLFQKIFQKILKKYSKNILKNFKKYSKIFKKNFKKFSNEIS